MSPVNRRTRSSRVRLAATGAVVIVSTMLATLAGCTRGPAASTAACGQYQYAASSTVNPDQPHPGKFKYILVLLDLYSNSAQVSASIAQDISPYLQAAVADGVYVRIEADGGTGTQVMSSGCFDGVAPFLVTRANQTAQQKTQASAVTALDSILKTFVRSVKVAPQGSASRLLQGAAEEVGGLRASASDPIGSVQVILWSNLLGNTGKSDCLSVNGVPGTPAYASAIARRCFSEGQLTPLIGAGLDILGAGAGAVNDQQSLLAGDLASDLCGEYRNGCQVSPT